MAQTIPITRTVSLPDEVKVERCKRVPELGPRVLFFSGGTALRGLSRKLVSYTHNSLHIITPFDSGGSSAVLRKAFNMLAVGDIRNRLMALADRSVQGNPEIFELFAHRLDPAAPQALLRERLERLTKGEQELMAAVPDAMREIIRRHLELFVEQMPSDFNLKGASIGNLILTGGYLSHERQIDPVIFLFSRLVEAKGTVRPVVNSDMHLVSELENGMILKGQHVLTGKESAPITSPVKNIWLAESLQDVSPKDVFIRDKVANLIQGADLICYPPGSFYSSLLANVLPKGVGEAVRKAQCPKMYIPNLGHDPEAFGLGLPGGVEKLVAALRQSAGDDTIPVSDLLHFVLVDTKNGVYPEPPITSDLDRIRAMGITVIDAPLVTPESEPLLDETEVIKILLSLA